jgi:hypothetical protein
MPKKLKIASTSSYRWEISIALLVKFLLLGGVWWLFFAGKKLPVDGAAIADKIYGDDHSAITSQQKREHLK